ncbi:hypothetical protein BS50DRAFT_633292 [Corynespora cassiicola Philippines]|uniref:Uncharacterized protein n=1 Tax=Corynespora cassiicola Philippines TaxID=1448308 RepID=A0A2T2NQ50_CORCC|nr:hypothetical protein BS50DRAFT_633292 [Corynespora cassiicola Philippines]
MEDFTIPGLPPDWILEYTVGPGRAPYSQINDHYHLPPATQQQKQEITSCLQPSCLADAGLVGQLLSFAGPGDAVVKLNGARGKVFDGRPRSFYQSVSRLHCPGPVLRAMHPVRGIAAAELLLPKQVADCFDFADLARSLGIRMSFFPDNL